MTNENNGGHHGDPTKKPVQTENIDEREDNFIKNYKSYADEIDEREQVKTRSLTPPLPEAPRPVSVLELERLKAARERPAPVPEYTMGGSMEMDVRKQSFQEREQRIGHIEERLAEKKDHARHDFNLTQQLYDRQEIERNERER